MNGVNKMSFIKRRDEKHRQIQEGIENLKKQLSQLEQPEEKLLKLCDMSLTELHSELCAGNIKPVDLLRAYQLKAIKLYERGNSGICEFVIEAAEQATQLPQANSERSELYGIPISVKELFPIRGYDCTMGLFKLSLDPSKEDSILIKVLRAQGAIPFVLTATSQMAFSLSGYNPVFGDLKHPHSKDHIPGGSSTGEAVLLSQNGSPIGLGTDAAGSIRIPCAFCGLTGLKPTAQRLGCRGSRQFYMDSTLIMKTCPGPMGKRVDDLVRVMRTLLCPTLFQLDSSIPPLLFNEELYSGSKSKVLKVGFYDNLNDPNMLHTVPSVRRAIRKAVNVLKQNGFSVTEFNPPELYKALKLGFAALMADGGREFQCYSKDEPMNENTKALGQLFATPQWVRAILDARIRKSLGKPAAFLTLIRKLSGITEVTEVINGIAEYQNAFETAMLDVGDLDIIICPPWPFPAPKETTSSYITTPGTIYAALYNILDYPAGVVPMGVVEKGDVEEAQALSEEYEKQGDIYHQQVMRTQQDSEGLPLSVQVVGKPFREELVLRVMKILEAAQQC